MNKITQYLKTKKVEAAFITLLSAAAFGITSGYFEHIGYQIAENSFQQDEDHFSHQPNEFSNWMNLQDFRMLISSFKVKINGISHWDRGFWMEDIQGKYEDGHNQFRLKYTEQPDGYFWWYWYYGITDERLEQVINKHSQNGFLIYKHTTFTNSSGRNRHQIIFRKTRNG